MELRERGFDRPQIAVITGMVKDSGRKFSDRDHAKARNGGSLPLAARRFCADYLSDDLQPQLARRFA